MDGDLLLKGAVIAAVLGVLWVLPDWAAHRERLLRAARRLHLAAPPPPRPDGPPIERIAADVRRIRAEIRNAPPGLPVARMRGWLEAYDDVLVAACRALGLEERLDDPPSGPRHDLERQRVERVLAVAGVLHQDA